jgi:phosphoenolpyruvate synthase/pyruvate phosphate dikinase
MEVACNFGKLGKNKVALAGGKGAALSKMTRAGISVPPGFIIFSTTFERFLEEFDLNAEIDLILQSVNYKAIRTVEHASKKIRSLIINTEVPEDVTGEIQIFFKNLGAKYVAVRSSATVEDSASAAWAGQLDSYLNTTEENLLGNIKKCWASLFTPRAIFYRFEKGLCKQKISVAVVIQKMVKSETSGVAFSAHPITGDRDQIVIEAGFGLGEAIVSGQITPDNYIVEKNSWLILDKNTNKQKRFLVRAKQGGNEWKKLKGKKQVLSDTEITKLARLVLKMEKFFSFPIDVEWAREKGKTYILQSRPITTLKIQTAQTIYKKQYNRSLSLVECEYWDYGERVALPRICDGTTFFEPLFIQIPNKGTDICYNFSDPKQDTDNLFEYLGGSDESFLLLLDKYDSIFNKISDIVQKKHTCAEDIFKLIRKVWPGMVILLANNQLKRLKPNLRSKAYELRKRTGDVVYDASNRLLGLLRDTLPRGYKQYADLISFKEVISGKLPTRLELNARSNGFIYFRGKVFTGDLDEFVAAHDILLETEAIDNKKNSIKGSTAWVGKITGKVKIIYEENQIAKVSKGDILVTSMSTPDFLPAMQRASAFVTDEGGITCHAAIVAREMKKPCIVGTKIATRILNDGDTVEVDANNGIVRIIKQ